MQRRKCVAGPHLAVYAHPAVGLYLLRKQMWRAFRLAFHGQETYTISDVYLRIINCMFRILTDNFVMYSLVGIHCMGKK